MSQRLSADQVRWVGIRFMDQSRFLDAMGRLFVHEGEFYRAIYPAKAPLVNELFSRGIVPGLMDKGWLVRTKITPFELEGYGMVLWHERAPHYMPHWFWGRRQLRDAARMILEINLELHRHGLALLDTHGGNLAQFGAARPAWIDFGSIGRLDDMYVNAVINEFRTSFTHPLRLFAGQPHLTRVTRLLMQTGGIKPEEIGPLLANGSKTARRMADKQPRLAPAGDRLETTWEHHKHSLQRRIQRKLRQWGLLAEASGKAGFNVEKARGAPYGATPKAWEALLRAELDALPKEFPELDTLWSQYQKQELLPASYARAGSRPAAVLRVLRELKPRRVVDLAANAGFYSFMAARQGAEVLAVECDETAVDRLYEAAQRCREPVSVTAGCYDATRPPRDRGSTNLAAQNQGELVLALALTHHLALGQFYSFHQIAYFLSYYSTDAALTEFMPHGLGVSKPSPNPLPNWYTLENFQQAMGRRFHTVEVLDTPVDPANPRVMILCRGVKKAEPGGVRLGRETAPEPLRVGG